MGCVRAGHLVAGQDPAAQGLGQADGMEAGTSWPLVLRPCSDHAQTVLRPCPDRAQIVLGPCLVSVSVSVSVSVCLSVAALKA
eukprot:784967-Rhodomonas_salina.1